MATSTSSNKNQRVVPTQVLDEEYVYAFPPDFDEEVDKRGFVGKWMLFASVRNPDEDGLRELDRLWFKIDELIQTGELYYANCSTGGPAPDCTFNDGEGVICMYTKDYRDKEDVRRKAEQIREVLGPLLRRNLRYKTNHATEANQYVKYVNFGVSIYKYTIGGLFLKSTGVKGKWHRL